jgi:hypothetical protein
MGAASRSAPGRRMSKSVVFAAYRLRGAALACLLATANCAQLPPTSSVAIPSIPFRVGAALVLPGLRTV